MTFFEKDDIGLDREYLVITEYEFDDSNYVIYTDLVFDKSKNIRLFVGKVINNKIMRLAKDKEKIIIENFKNEEKKILRDLKESFLWNTMI